MSAPDVVFDLAVIGGGVNGCGIARAAALRGHKVYLCEQDDLASATSSASTKLIHGGLRYLEHREFRLVRESLREREVLWRMAPHLIRPMRFVLPHHPGMRPAWLLRLGLFLYDHLGGRERLPGTRKLRLRKEPAGVPLQDRYALGFEYSDCCVDDARLVIALAQDARQRGAVIRTRVRAASAKRENGAWSLTVEDRHSGDRAVVRAKVLVNAAGPWVASVLADRLGLSVPAHVRLVQGSHIVTRRLFDHAASYIFQNADGRIVFAIPFERDFTLLGTTDRDYEGDPASPAATDAEVAYLCKTASTYFTRTVTPADVVWTYAGVRPLHDDGAASAQAVTRDYLLALDGPPDAPVLLSVFGGKITTFRRLADAALARISPFLPPATAGAPGTDSALPGGDLPVDGVAALAAEVQARHPYIAPEHVQRLVHLYGSRVWTLLRGVRAASDLGRMFGADLSESEVAYLMAEEWAETAADVVWRRTKLGLRMTAAEVQTLDAWMMSRRARQSDKLPS
ncbi:MAG TPA: glycerol-3-phosphate dehydrogenase [Alphaproteobacteria bacterium]|nr:glycerol-3-phosphate dehydrogenase [Alphaproteobacteria bacterium]